MVIFLGRSQKPAPANPTRPPWWMEPAVGKLLVYYPALAQTDAAWSACCCEPCNHSKFLTSFMRTTGGGPGQRPLPVLNFTSTR